MHLNWLSVAVVDPNQKQLGNESAQPITEESQGRDLEARNEADAMEECYSLAFASMALLSLPSYTIQNHQPRGSSTHSEVYPSTSIITQENAPQTCHGVV